MADRANPAPGLAELKALAEDLIGAQSTMTLATAKEDVAWSAPVYYVYWKGCFYFFSDPSARHIQESLAGGRAAASIFASASTWKEIRGIQMAGTVETIPGKREAAKPIMAYLKKFSFTKEFFLGGQTLDLDAFAGRFRVRLYRFIPDLVYYLDNRIRFGFREEVSL